jgi:hypothetical protein
VSPILGIWASQNYSRYSLPTSFDSIATTTVGAGGSSTVTFSSIPSTYTHLQIRMLLQTTTTGTGGNIVRISFNGNSMTKTHYLYADGSGVSSGVGTAGDLCNIPKSGNTSIFAGCIVDILDYTDTNKNKTIRSLGGYDANGSGELTMYSNLYATNTNAITSITLTPSANNFSQYSSFALYGIKGA